MTTHYFDSKQTSKLNLDKIKIRVFEDVFELFTASGIFSREKLDNASKLLIENANLENANSILDLGCGLGVIGISLKRKYPNLQIDFSDVNERAVMITRKNLELHNIKANSYISDGFEKITNSYDTILLNPPYAAGRDVCYKLISDSHKYINEGGSLQIVARHQKGGKMLQKKIEEVFKNSEVLAKGGGFRVYMGRK